MTNPVDMTVNPHVSAFFDEATNTISYIVSEPDGDHCAIIDSVMDIDYAAGRITFDSADALIAEVQRRDLKLDWIIETHVHADHLSAAPYLKERLGGKVGVGDKITVVQDTFGKVFNEGTEFQRDGSQFDALFKDRRHAGFCHRHAGAYACLHGACDRGCVLCRRYAFHA
jgi:glyoxylase-like metal-dependent hydrolase (beta-lactamase superfamily II)